MTMAARSDANASRWDQLWLGVALLFLVFVTVSFAVAATQPNNGWGWSSTPVTVIVYPPSGNNTR